MTSVRALYDSAHGIVSAYERHLSAAAMVVGFGLDSLTFGRVDRPAANIVFGAYLAIAFAAIVLAHNVQQRMDRRVARIQKQIAMQSSLRGALNRGGANVPTPDDTQALPPARTKLDQLFEWLPVATQFALGGLWSGFLVFYGRSAALAASWPFILLLALFLVGNEVFRRYRSRLVFTALLFFFALYSYAIFVVPVFTKTIGKFTFLGSGVLAVLAFYFFLQVLALAGRERYRQSRWKIVGGAAAILAVMNLFYLTRILPPLPLAAADTGIYYDVKHKGDSYIVSGETEPWYVKAGFALPTMRLTAGQPLYLYAAVFAPIKLATRVSHTWQWYDPARKHWMTQSIVSFSINGGRDGGYRAYSIKKNPKPGEWRVNVESIDHRLIARVKFFVQRVAARVPTVTQTLN
ncbi:MAG TPA: DUF2914 domain-containing protein [Rhizomicrobium sp.]|jgi:hypothetical protein